MSNMRATRDVSMTFYLLGVVLFCIAFGFPNWVQTAFGYAGLWEYCDKTLSWRPYVGCYYDLNFRLAPTYLQATQALMIVALFWNCIAFVFYVMWRMVPAKQLQLGAGSVALTSACMMFLTGLFEAAAVVVFASQYSRYVYLGAGDLSYSWYCALVGAAIFTFNGLITLTVMAFTD